MRKSHFHFIALIVCLASCKKHDNAPVSNYWKTGYINQKANVLLVNGMITYPSSVTTVNANELKGVSGSHSITYKFKAIAGPGIYRIVSGPPDSGEVTFNIAGVNSHDAYAFGGTGKDTVSVLVSSQNNKLRLTMTNAWAKESNGGGDSVLVSANLEEN